MQRLPITFRLTCFRAFIILASITLITLTSVKSYSQILLINEILTSTSETDQNGTPLEWVEIFNAGSEAVDLVQYSLTDDLQNPRKWNFPPVTLEPGGYFLAMATAYDYYNPGEYHTNFRLDADGEYLAIYRNSDLLVIDSINYPVQQKNVSYGRDPNTPEKWVFLDPTPKKVNPADGSVGSAEAPVFSIPGGAFDAAVTVELSTDQDDADIRYTLDGSPPSQTSPIYTNPITINKSTPLRASVFMEEYAPSDIITHTYFINEDMPLPIISLVTDPPGLWDRSKGIYANASQHGPNWERSASMEYIKLDGSRWFGVDAGVRIHGGASRDRAEKKSFRVYFRTNYGPGRLNIPLIPSTPLDDFDSFILRAGYNDSWIHWDAIERQVAVYISDQLGRTVHGDMGSVFCHGIYAGLYLNADYWGVYNLCERVDSDFLDSYYGDEEWDIISDDEVKEGDKTEWNRLITFAASKDMRNDDNYAQLVDMIDLEQVTSYYILNIWVQNHDWPHHNWFTARERRPDGKWKFLVWDMEDSFGSGVSRGSYNMNSFTNAQQGGSLGTLFKALLNNDQYKQYFMDRLYYYLDTVLNPEHLLPMLDDQANQIRVGIPSEAERWNQNMNIDVWEEALNTARTFINNRTEFVLNHVTRAIKLPTPTPTPAPVKPTPTPGGPTPTPTSTPTVTPTPVQPIPGEELGIFEASVDIGDALAAEGEALFDASTGVYTVTGSGTDIWGTQDEFHFLYKQISGDFSLEAEMSGENLGGSDWAKITLMARDSLDADARHFAPRLQESTLQASSQWRMETGGSAGSSASGSRINANQHDGRFRLVRDGDDFNTYYFSVDLNDWSYLDGQTIFMDDPIYIGLAVTSHDNGNYAKGFYENVKLTLPHTVIYDWMMH